MEYRIHTCFVNNIDMRQLRKKIEPGPESLKLIINEPGIGYRLRVI